jgi:hypothetical protein
MSNIKLSDAQRVILTRLVAGWRLQFRNQAHARWYDQQGNPCGPVDMRRTNALWKRGLIFYRRTREEEVDQTEIGYLELTAAGRAAIAEGGKP